MKNLALAVATVFEGLISLKHCVSHHEAALDGVWLSVCVCACVYV